MNCKLLSAIVALCACAVFASAQDAPPKPTSEHPIDLELCEQERIGALTPEDRELARMLRERTVTIVIDRVKPGDLIDLMSQALDTTIRVSNNVLLGDSVRFPQHIEYRAEGLSAFDAMDLLLETLNRLEKEPLRWSVSHGRIIIGRVQDQRTPSTIIVYDVRDLVHNVEAAERAKRTDEIIALIQESVDPDGWRDLGGEVGSVQSLDGNLIITNTAPNHEAIQQLLAQIRRQAQVHVRVEATVITTPLRINQLDLKLPALEQAVAGGAVAIASAERADAAMQILLDARGTNVLTSPRLTVRNGGEATLTIEGGRTVTLPILGENGAAPVRLLDGAAVRLEPNVDQDNDHFTLTLNARMSGIDQEGEQFLQRLAERSLRVNMTDGDVAIIELPVALHKLLGLRRTTDPLSDTQTLEVIRQPVGEAKGQTVLLILRSKLVVPEDQE